MPTYKKKLDTNKKHVEIVQSPTKNITKQWVTNLYTALAPLFITAVFFMIGWSYESNWYEFFGLKTEQLNIPLQHIFIRSFQTLILTFYAIPISIIFYAWARYIVSKFILLNNSDSKGWLWDISKPYNGLDWLVIAVVSYIGLVIMGISPFFTGFKLAFQSIELKALLLLTFLAIFPATILLVYYFYIVLLFFARKHKVANIFNIVIPSKISKPVKKILTRVKLETWITVAGVYILLSMLLISSGRGISDASRGIGVLKVYLASPKQLIVMKEFEQFCDVNKNCNYGPFGLVAENNNSFYLIKWKNQGQERFEKHPGLFIMPRNDQSGAYFIIPANPDIQATIPLIIFTITSTLQPPQSATIEPQSTATVTPIVIPTITLTPAQP